MKIRVLRKRPTTKIHLDEILTPTTIAELRKALPGYQSDTFSALCRVGRSYRGKKKEWFWIDEVDVASLIFFRKEICLNCIQSAWRRGLLDRNTMCHVI